MAKPDAGSARRNCRRAKVSHRGKKTSKREAPMLARVLAIGTAFIVIAAATPRGRLCAKRHRRNQR
jgi:hypothetical protein